MAEMLLVNPRKRRKNRKRNPTAAQKRARAAFAAAARARSRNPAKRRVARKRNPTPYALAYELNPRRRRRKARRSNPVPLLAYRRARRRNPIGGLSVGGIVGQMKETAIMGAGAVGMDVLYGYIARYLPANMQAGPGQLTMGSVAKLVITAGLGQVLNRPTNGLAGKAARGSLVVQFRDIAAGLLPSLGLPGLSGRLGYATPASRVVNYSPRVGPNRTSLGAYTSSAPPLLNAYTAPGVTPMLSGSARARESVMR